MCLYTLVKAFGVQRKGPLKLAQMKDTDWSTFTLMTTDFNTLLMQLDNNSIPSWSIHSPFLLNSYLVTCRLSSYFLNTSSWSRILS